MVGRFIRRCLLLGLPALAIPGAYLWTLRETVPAPRITNNIALNEKLAFVRERFPDGVDVLAVGSSMTLNNLASAGVVAHFGTERYVNAAAWGLGAAELPVLGTLLTDRLRPHTVLVATNLMDFRSAGRQLGTDSAAMARYLDGGSRWAGHLRHWDAPYLLRQAEANRIRFHDPGNYEYLGFDGHGGATLDVPAARIDRARFNEAPPSADQLDEARYAAFAGFARWLHDRGVRLVVLQCAYRDGLRTPAVDALQRAHTGRLRDLLEPLGHTVIDANAHRWPDSLYVDGSHLGRAGAARFTDICLPPRGAGGR
ncbi:MAG: hypothetical protein IT228_12615 [Flavobacteriales bacterium]|nr:hypothetical protein [Flavobacteriales bacterium]MCC6578176.1 hypothetical protein [Flavobacteriales bacterium]NUQ14678.1 hypothetical protein [Flavobacteriales bacterium]